MPFSKNGDFINKLVWGKCNFLRIWLYYITLQKYNRFHLYLMKWPSRRMLRNFSYILEYFTKNSWFLFLNECGREKLSNAKKELYQNDGNFWSLSLDNFIKHEHLNFWRVWLNILLCIYFMISSHGYSYFIHMFAFEFWNEFVCIVYFFKRVCYDYEL